MTDRFQQAIERTKQPNRFEAAVERAREAAASAPAPEQRGSFFDPLMQGLTFGTADEIGGWIGGDEVRDDMRANYDAYKERRPWASMGAEALGALPSALVPGGAIMRGATTAGRIGRGFGLGAASGGFYGFNQGEGDLSADRVTGAVGGAATGAAVGAALPAAGAGLGRLYRALMDRISPNAATKAGINRAAQGEINRTLEADDMTVQDMASRLREYGPDAAMVDASDGMRETGRQMVQFGSPGNAPLAKLGKERGRQVASRVGGAFEEVLGKRPAPAELVEALKKRTQRNAGANYGAARDAVAEPDNIPYNPALQPALDVERSIMQRSRLPEGDAPDGTYEFLTNAQRRISGKKRAAEQSRDAGGGSAAYDDAAVLKADEGELVMALDNATDGLYSKARENYADDVQLGEAFDYGFKKAMSNGTEISFLKKEWDALPKPAKVAARAGVRAWLGQKSASFRGARSEGRNVFREGDYRDKLKIVFGDKVTDRLSKAMEGQEAMWLSDDALQRAGGSQTARNIAGRINPANQKIDKDVSFLGLGLRGAQKAVNSLNRPNSLTRSLGPALAAQGGERDKLLQALLDIELQKTMGQPSQTVQSILRNSAGGGMMAPATVMQPEDAARLFNGTKITVYPRR